MSLFRGLRLCSVLLLVLGLRSMHAQFGAPAGGGGKSNGPTVSLGGLGDTGKPPTVHNRRLQGTVLGADGKHVANAVVYIKNLKSKETATIIADENGAYRIGALDKNADYQLWAKIDKTTGPVKTVSEYDTRDELTVNLHLE